MTRTQKKDVILLSVATGELIAISILAHIISLPNWVSLLTYLVPYFTVGFSVLKKAAVNTLHLQMTDENFLMAIATVGSVALGDYPEAVFVMIFYRVGELFESIAVGKSRKSISELMDICPDVATVIRDGVEVDVSPEEVNVGEITVIRPGGKVPLDGVIVKGFGRLNTVAMTGEPIPRDVTVGDRAISGCINTDGVLYVQTDKIFGESTVSKILELVENSSSVKSKSENFITRFSKYYTPAVIIIALGVAFIPPLFVGSFAQWIRKGLMMLVVSCPCALVLSVPLAFFGGIGGASRDGILIKGSEYLEKLAKTKSFVFDKTGTLTKGNFVVTSVNGDERTLMLASSAENYSTHPIAQSLKNAYSGEILQAEDIREYAGMGVEAKIDGKSILAGNGKLMDKFGIKVTDTKDKTVVYVAENGALIGTVTLGDEIKPETAKFIEEIKKEGIEETVMLTGDSEEVASAVASQVGINTYFAELLPENKVEYLEKIMSGNKVTAYVGDGINDAPVLARADVGISMGAFGSDAAIEASDIVLMNDRIDGILKAIRIAKRTQRIVWENIIFSLGIKCAVLIMCAFDMTTMGVAVFADVGVLVLAVLNSMRGLKKQ